MALHPILNEKLNAAVLADLDFQATRRDAVLPAVPGKVQAVIGLRRAGKTTFLRQLQGDWRTSAPAERVVYLSFDDDRLSDLPVEQPGLALEEYYRRYPELRGRERVWWLLDEIQLVMGWERFIRRVLDTERMEIVVSGSSARMLSREVHTSLRGRGMETVIRPFSFREFLRHRGLEPARRTREFTKTDRSRIEKEFREYLAGGGFPEAQGLGVAKDALHAMMGHLQDAFLISTMALATDSERRRNSNPRRVYPVDNGLIGAFDRSGRTNVGHALETIVLHELERRKAEIGYVRTGSGYEVDFHARYPDGREELIQVCAETGSGETPDREWRALHDAEGDFPRARHRLLTPTFDQLPAMSTKGIASTTVYDWLLGN